MVCKLRSQAKPWTNNTGPQDNTHPSTTPPTIHLHSGLLPTGHCTTLQYRSLMCSSRNWLGREGKGTTVEYPSCKCQITHPHTIHSWNRCLRDIHPPNPNPNRIRNCNRNLIPGEVDDDGSAMRCNDSVILGG